jgi:hypothetical protein
MTEQQQQEAIQVLRELTKKEHVDNESFDECIFCDMKPVDRPGAYDVIVHAESCPWLRARKLLQQLDKITSE